MILIIIMQSVNKIHDYVKFNRNMGQKGGGIAGRITGGWLDRCRVPAIPCSRYRAPVYRTIMLRNSDLEKSQMLGQA